MVSELAVLMNGQLAGTLMSRARGASFEYDASYRADVRATPVSLSLPLQLDSHPPSRVTPWLWGLLPDNSDVLGRWAREFRVSASSPFPLLSTPIGEDCAGAVQFVRPDRLDAVLSSTGSIRWLKISEVASRLAALRGDASAWLGPDFEGQFSLAGAQAKTALYRKGRRWGVPSGAAATTHILKPAIAGLDDHDLNEHLCLTAARRVGLTASRTTIMPFEEQTAVVVERYDRIVRNEGVTRIHQEDLCQALGLPPSRKYQTDGGPGVAAIVRLLRDAIKPASAAERAVWAFFEALAWNWVIAGTDAHAKNYSLLLSGQQVRLAPLYDVASILPYAGVDELKLKLAMKLGGEYRLKAHNSQSWPKVARELGLDAEAVRSRVLELLDRAPAALADAASTPEVRKLSSPLGSRLVDAVALRTDRCRKQMEPSA